jgi:hypothetical protein
MAHDGDAVEGRLPVEEDDVAVDQVAVHNVAELEGRRVVLPDLARPQCELHQVAVKDACVQG